METPSWNTRGMRSIHLDIEQFRRWRLRIPANEIKRTIASALELRNSTVRQSMNYNNFGCFTSDQDIELSMMKCLTSLKIAFH